MIPGSTAPSVNAPPACEMNKSVFRFQLSIGVCGHRDLTDSGMLSGQIQAGLQTILNRYTESPQIPIDIIVWSALAEGADRLLVREILKRPRAQLRTVLPLAPDEYCEDFSSDASRREFWEYLALDAEAASRAPVFTLSGSNHAEQAELRKEAYRKAGELIAQRCDVLLAIWDGQPARGTGGTAEVIAFAQTRHIPVVVVSSLPPHCVYSYGSGCYDTHGYESLVIFAAHDLQIERETILEASTVNLFGDGKFPGLPVDGVRSTSEILLPHYLRASTLARRTQRQYYTASASIYGFAAAAVLLVVAGSLFEQIGAFFFATEAAAMLVILYLVRLARRKDYHRKWIEFRLLAERLRVACYLQTCGMAPAPLSHINQDWDALHQNQWVVQAYNSLLTALPAPVESAHQDFTAARSFLDSQWLDAQMRFHHRKAERCEHKDRMTERAVDAAFYLAFAAACGHIAMAFMEHHLGEAALGLSRLLTLAALALPAVGAALSVFRKHREYERMAVRSREMEQQLRGIRRTLERAVGPVEFERIIRAADELMLAESQDWRKLVSLLTVQKV